MKAAARIVLLIFTSMLFLAMPTQAYAAETCGTEDANGDPILGTLVYDPNKSTQDSIDFGWDKGDRSVSLVYMVEGCRLPGVDSISISEQTTDPLDKDAVFSPSIPILDSDGTLRIDLTIHPLEFHPGEYNFQVIVSDPDNLSTAYTRVTMKRTEENWLIPGGIWLVAVAIGVFWAWAQASPANRAWKTTVGGAALALGAAYAILATSYFAKGVIWKSPA